MANVESLAKTLGDEPGLPAIAAEVSVPEVRGCVWRRPQGVACGDFEEGERWDGLS